MSTSTITSKNQMTVPADVRAALGLKPGDRIRFTALSDGGFRAEKAEGLEALRGIIRPKVKLSAAELDALIAERRGR
jgi:antitoxin PrlF